MNLVLSALDLVPLVEGGTSSGAIRESVALARTLEEKGYRRVWYAEHHNMPGVAATTPEVMIAHVANSTSRIRVGSGGVMLPNHAPLKVAETYRLLETMHPGRIDLGIGRAPGTDPWTAAAMRRAYGPGRAGDLVEQLGELRHFDAGTFPGNHPYAGIRVMPDDVRLPPIWLLGSSDFSARLAAELGLGFAFAGHFSADVTPLRQYREAFRPGALERPHAILTLAAFAAESEEAAQRLASSSLRMFIDLRSGTPRRLQSPDVAMRKLTPEESEIAEQFRSIGIVGVPEQVRAEIESRAEHTGADEIMIATLAFDAVARRRSYELIADVLRA